MKNLNFKNWFEDAAATAKSDDLIKKDPKLLAASQAARSAAQSALKKNQNPIKAAQQTVVNNPNVPVNKLGAVIPTSDDDKSPL